MNIEIKKFEELSIYELYEILKIRAEIFVVEQECPYNDVDGKDIKSTHIMIKNNGKIEGYLRVLPPGISFESSSLGRVLIKEEGRKKGLGKILLKEGIKHVFQVYKENVITIGAQAYLIDFYKSFGFEPISEIYLEDNIPHLNMKLQNVIFNDKNK